MLIDVASVSNIQSPEIFRAQGSQDARLRSSHAQKTTALELRGEIDQVTFAGSEYGLMARLAISEAADLGPRMLTTESWSFKRGRCAPCWFGSSNEVLLRRYGFEIALR
jgi:hypothetical protein